MKDPDIETYKELRRYIEEIIPDVRRGATEEDSYSRDAK